MNKSPKNANQDLFYFYVENIGLDSPLESEFAHEISMILSMVAEKSRHLFLTSIPDLGVAI